jgi:bacterioferritin (cytochrome b1)
VLATELVCVLRYFSHSFTAKGIRVTTVVNNLTVKVTG